MDHSGDVDFNVFQCLLPIRKKSFCNEVFQGPVVMYDVDFDLLSLIRSLAY
jgi:hypothetical protein